MFIDCNSRRNTKNANIFKRAKALSLCLTVFCTSGAFAFPVFADEYKCGLEEHSHTVECYEPTSADDENAVLICDSYDEEHVHGDSCYGKLICEKTRHIHDDECLNNRIRSGEIHEVSSEEGLKSAIASANTGDYISIKADIDMSGGITINKDLTILGNGHEIYFPTGGDNNRISISNGATVNLGDKDDSDNTLVLRGPNKQSGEGPGFIAVEGKAKLNMYDGVTVKDYINNNYFGGGVTLRNGIFNMYGGTIENCGISGGAVNFGGGVAVTCGSTFTMEGGTIKNCFATTTYYNGWQVPSGAGGGVFVGQGATFVMNGGTIKDCTATSDGGGVCVIASSDSYFYNNRQFGYLDSKFIMTDGTIEGNKAGIVGNKAVGGGVAVLGTYINVRGMAAPTPGAGAPKDPGVYISGGNIENNSAQDGGGIFLNWIRPTVKIENCTISGNKADNGAGVSILSYWTQAVIKNCTIKENIAESLGGGISLRENSSSDGTTINKCVIKENKSDVIGGGLYLSDNSSVNFDDDCAVYNNTAEVGADDIYKDESSVINNLPTPNNIG